MDEQVSVKWKYATGVLTLGLVAQFFWWNKQCPQVFGAGGSGYSGLSSGHRVSRR